jgi:hypothetical protein
MVTRRYLLGAEGLHDASLVGIEFDDRVLELIFRHVNGSKVKLRVDDVIEVAVFGLGMRSTIDGIYTEEINPENVEKVIEELRLASGNRVFLGSIGRISQMILDMSACLLVVEPSEGGGVLAVSELSKIRILSD